MTAISPFRVLLGQGRRVKPPPPPTTQRLDCPTGMVGAGQYQSRTVTWNIANQAWDVGPWTTYSYQCVLQPTYMEASIPGDGDKYGTIYGSMAGIGMIQPVVSTSYVSSNRGGYTANAVIAFRGSQVTDANCQAFGLDPARVVFVSKRDLIQLNIVANVNHNYGGGFLGFDVRNPGSQYVSPGSGKAESVGGWATATKTYLKGYTLSGDGRSVSFNDIIGPYEIVMASFNTGGVTRGTVFKAQIYRQVLPEWSGSKALDIVKIAPFITNMNKWITGPRGIQFRANGTDVPLNDWGGRGFAGTTLQFSVPGPGVLVLYDSSQHSRHQPEISGSAIAFPATLPITRGMGEVDSYSNVDPHPGWIPGALVLPVQAGSITVGPNWNSLDSRDMSYDYAFGWTPL